MTTVPPTVIIDSKFDLTLPLQEFVLGNTAAFFDTPRVATVSPRLARPDKNHETYAPETSTSGR